MDWSRVSDTLFGVTQVISRTKHAMSSRILDHSLNASIFLSLKSLLIDSCHRITKAREVAFKTLDKLITGFPSLMCDSALVFALLEVLTLVQGACDGAQLDEYTPKRVFHAERSNITISLTDVYATRKTILATLHSGAEKWLELAIGRANFQCQAILQKYLTDHGRNPQMYATELGASLALKYSARFSALQQQRFPKSSLDHVTPDRAKLFASELSAHSHFAGEAAGVRLANRLNQSRERRENGSGEIQKAPPTAVPEIEIAALKSALGTALVDIQKKTSKMSQQDLKRLLMRCAAVLESSPEVCAIPQYDPSQFALMYSLRSWTMIYSIISLPSLSRV